MALIIHYIVDNNDPLHPVVLAKSDFFERAKVIVDALYQNAEEYGKPSEYIVTDQMLQKMYRVPDTWESVEKDIHDLANHVPKVWQWKCSHCGIESSDAVKVGGGLWCPACHCTTATGTEPPTI